MKTKKLLAMMLASVLAFAALAMAACGGAADEIDAPADEAIEETVEDAAEDEAAEDDTAIDEAAAPALPQIEDGESILEALANDFIAVDELSGSTWYFAGGYIQGRTLTDEQVSQIEEQMNGDYSFAFNDESAVTLTEGDDTVTEGTYAAAEGDTPAIKIEVGGVTYAALFIADENGNPTMIALTDSTGLNALYFRPAAV